MSKPNRQWNRDGDEGELRDRHTVATDPDVMSWWLDTRRPETATEALMQAAPGDTPLESADELQARIGPLRDALEDPDLLTDKEVFVIEMMFFAGKSTREMATMMPWSTTQIHRIKHTALEKLEAHLADSYGEWY